MPRRAAYGSEAIAELERQLAFAPTEALARQMAAAERLAQEIEEGAAYPLEFVVWRLTGFRPEAAPPQPLSASTLRKDLAVFVLRISERLPLRFDDREGGAIALADLARELGVVEKTLRRWRARGLLCHRVILEDGRSRVAVYRSELGQFAQRHPQLVADAASFSRMDDATARAAMARIAALVDEGLTPNLAAKRVAKELGRSHEGIRQLLQRNTTTLSALRGPRGRPAGGADRPGHDRRLAYRAWRRGVSVERIAKRLGAKVDAVRRRVDMSRGERLRATRITWTEFVTFERVDAEETILAAPAVRGDLAPRFDPPEALALLEKLAAERDPGAKALAAEEAMLAAYNVLKRRSRHAIDGLGRAPDRLVLDRIETDLRWALRLKRRLVECWLGTGIASVEQAIAGPLTRRSTEEIRALLERTVAVVVAVIEDVDPSRRQSPRRVVAFETDRMLARQGVIARPARASARHERGQLPLPRLFERLVPWTDTVDLLAHRRSLVSTLPAETAALLARRHGWDGTPPRSLPELAREERTTVAVVTKRLADAERLLRAAT